MTDVCYCGHMQDEHEDTAMEPCGVEGCPCTAFDPDEEARP